jgi:hypothetical protein
MRKASPQIVLLAPIVVLERFDLVAQLLLYALVAHLGDDDRGIRDPTGLSSSVDPLTVRSKRGHPQVDSECQATYQTFKVSGAHEARLGVVTDLARGDEVARIRTGFGT